MSFGGGNPLTPIFLEISTTPWPQTLLGMTLKKTAKTAIPLVPYWSCTRDSHTLVKPGHESVTACKTPASCPEHIDLITENIVTDKIIIEDYVQSQFNDYQIRMYSNSMLIQYSTFYGQVTKCV